MADSSRTIGKLLVDVDFNMDEIRAKLKSIGSIDSVVNRSGVKSDVDYVHNRLDALNAHIRVTKAEIASLRKATNSAVGAKDSLVNSKAVNHIASLRKAEQVTEQERIKAQREIQKITAETGKLQVDGIERRLDMEKKTFEKIREMDANNIDRMLKNDAHAEKLKHDVAADLKKKQNQTEELLNRDLNKAIIAEEKDLRNSRLRNNLEDLKKRNAQELIYTRSRAKMMEAANRDALRSTRKSSLTSELATISNSLNRIDTATTRFLRRSALAFTAWSVGVTAAVGGFVAFSITKFAELEQASVQAASVFSTDKFLGDLKRAGETIQSGSERQFDTLIKASSKAVLEQSKQVALETLFSPTDIAVGLRSLAQAGFEQQEALNAIGVTAKFAQNELIGVEDAVQVLGGAFASSGIDRTEENFKRLTDQFTVTAAASQASAKDIADAFSNSAAGLFRAYGQSAEQALTVISLFAKANKRGRDAGTLTGIVIRDITNAYTKNQEVFAKYGVQYGRAADGSVIPFTKTLLQLAKAQDAVTKAQGSSGVSRFRKELGLTDKASRGFAILYPQLLKDGQRFTDDVLYNLNNATGATERIAKQQATTISFLFQNVMETFGNVLRDFGEQAAVPELRKLLEDLGGSGSEIVKLSPFLRRVGKDFGSVFASIREFVKSNDFVTGLNILYDSVLITLNGVRLVFSELGKAFGDGKKDSSGFVAFAEAVRSFARISATVLPLVARFVGEIVNFALENQKLVKAFISGALALTLFSKGLNLLVRPLDAVSKIMGGMAALNFSERILGMASALGVYTKSAKSARAASESLAVAQAAQGLSGGGSAAAQGAGMLGKVKKAPIPKGGLIGAGVAAGVIATTAAVKGFNDELKRMEKQGKVSKVEIDKLKKNFDKLKNSVKDIGKDAFDKFTRPFEKFGRDFAVTAVLINNGISSIQSGIDNLKNPDNNLEDVTGLKVDAIDTEGLKEFNRIVGQTARILEDQVAASGKFVKINGKYYKTAAAQAADAGAKYKNFAAKAGEAFNSIRSQERRTQLKQVRKGLDQFGGAIRGVVGKSKLLRGAAANLRALNNFKFKRNPFGTLINAIDKLKFKFDELSVARRNALGNLLLEKSIEKNAAKLATFSPEQYLEFVADERNRYQELLTFGQMKTGGGGTGGGGGGGGPTPTPTPEDTTGGGGGESSEAYKRSAEDQARLDYIRLTGMKKVRAENKLLQKVLADSKGLYKANRLEILLLEDAASKFEKRIEKQTKLVDNLTSSLDALKNTQIEGTKAFSDQLFNIDQQVKQLQLNRLDVLATGQTEESAPVKAIDAQIAALQAQSERVSLQESLQLDPLRRKLEETFNPVKELSFDNIIKQFTDLNAKISTQSGVLAGIEADRDRINATVEASQKRFEQLDFVLDQQQAAMDAAKSAAESTASSYSSVGSAAESATAKITGTNTALNKSRQLGTDSAKAIGKNLAAGVVHVNAGVNSLVNAISNKIASIGLRGGQVYNAAHTSGIITINSFIGGMNSRRGAAINTAHQISMSAAFGLRAYSGVADMSGVVLMSSFLSGMKRRMGDAKNMGKDTIAYYLHVTIPSLIRQLKGPLAYDATILVPAGEKIMDGFQSGLSRGFGKVAGFLKDVAPTISEQITADGFSNRLKPFMVDVALGKTPDPYEAFSDLIEGAYFTGASGGGITDPSLSFLHPTGSLKDTGIMARQLANMFDLYVASLYRPGSITSAGYISDHSMGTAADIALAGVNTPEAKKDALFEKIKPLLGTIFKQLIYDGRGYNADGGSFSDSQHYDHVHAAWLKDKNFNLRSDNIGTPLAYDFPGASDLVDAAIAKAASVTGISDKLIAAIAKQESGFNPNAGSYAGAQGLMQLMPGTAAGLGVKDVWDAEQNAIGGAKYIKQQLSAFGNNLSLALAAYNAGPGAAQTALNSYPETINYVKMVKKFFKEFGGFREKGGPILAGKKYVVGEKGPEIVSFDRPGIVYNNRETSRMMQNGGSKQNIINDNRVINVHSNASDPEAVAMIVDIHTKNRLVGVTGL